MGRGTFANKSMSSPHKTPQLQPRNWPKRSPIVRKARPLHKILLGAGPYICPVEKASFPILAPSGHMSMNENTQVGLPAPERAWKRDMYAYSEAATTRAKHVVVQRWEAWLDPWPGGGMADSQTIPACIISSFQLSTMPPSDVAEKLKKQRLRRRQQHLLSPIPIPT